MRKIILLIAILCAGCNLSASPPTLEPTYTPRPGESQNPLPTVTAASGTLPTSLPLSGLPPPPVPVTSAAPLGVSCQVYTTYSGVDPNNLLSLRQTPSTSALQVLRVPNNAAVLLVPNSSEVEAEAYHWLNVIYIDTAQKRYQGWMARDSFSTNGVRDPSIATLIPTGTQAAC